MVLELLLLLCSLALWWSIRDRQKYAGYPRGPTRLPLLGNLLQVALQFTDYPPLAFRKLAAKYGDVMFIKIGIMETVIVSSHEAATEVFQSNAFDRHMVLFAKERNMNGNYGIGTSTGKVSETMRRFTIRTLRDFGFGKSASMDEVINEEFGKFEKYLRTLITQGEGVVSMENTFDLPFLNVLWRLVTGKSHELDDARMKALVGLSRDYLRSIYFMDISLAYPALRHWFPKWTGKSWQIQCIQNLKEFIKNLVNEHKETQVYKNDPNCFVDVFLANLEEGKALSEFTDEQLIYVLLDLFQAGSDTTAAALSFVLLHMVRNPQIQRRVREEINSVLTRDTPVTTDLKQRLPFTYATILETLRYSNVGSLSIPREATKDVSIGGHKIEKGIPLIINLDAIHNDKSIWGDPEVFRPERFLTSEGTRINSKMTDYLVSFGGGKRGCLGQSLAETTLFIFFVNLMRRFDFKQVANQPVPRAEPKFGGVNSPYPFSSVVTEIL